MDFMYRLWMKNCHCHQHKGKRRNHSLSLKRNQRKCPGSRLHDLQNLIDKKSSDGYKIYIINVKQKCDECDVFLGCCINITIYEWEGLVRDQHTLSLAGCGVKAHARCSNLRHTISRCCRCFCLWMIGLALDYFTGEKEVSCTCQSLLA